LLSESTPLDGTHTATTSYTYNSFGEVLTVTGPLGHTTTNVYDAHGYQLQTLTDYVQALHAKEWVILLNLKWLYVTIRCSGVNYSARLVLGSIPQPEARSQTPQMVCVRSRQHLRRSHAEIPPCIP
jgi:YD repeat-containing protein